MPGHVGLKAKLNTTLDPAVLDRLRDRASQEDRTMSAVLTRAINAYLAHPVDRDTPSATRRPRKA